jgi:predicted membrane channel-forming protein YqfA (hemolysin III family)
VTFLLVLGIGGTLYAGGGIGYAIKVEGRTAANEGGVLALLPHKERCVDASDACWHAVRFNL